MENDGQKRYTKPKVPRSPWFWVLLAALGVMIFINIITMNSMLSSSVKVVEYSEFVQMVTDGKVEKVHITSEAVTFTLKEEGEPERRGLMLPRMTAYQTVPVNDPYLVERLIQAGVEFGGENEGGVSLFSMILTAVLPLAFYALIIYFMVRMIKKNGAGGMGAMSFGKSSAKMYSVSDESKKFSDVAGQDEAKEALIELVDFLHQPGKYRAIGAKLPKGALLVGPPGTGKTLLAKAVAGEAKVPFFSISGSEFVEMFVGMGAAKVRDLFKQANEKAPCIVFIDEIDTIGKRRDGPSALSGNDEREQTLNQLLSEMDGFDSRKGVILLAATNRPEILDKALLRPGRFDRRVQVELPDLKGRTDILAVHGRKVHLGENVNFEAIARATVGASGADLANIVNESALRAVRLGRNQVSQADLEEAVETVIAGAQRKNAVISQREKRMVAYHEIGHALVAAKQSDSAPVHKITIVPRTSGALGYTMQVESEETRMMTRNEAMSRLATLTAGRAAEELVLGTCSSGASNDIEQATKLARAMVTRMGMSEQFDMMALETVNNQYLGGDAALACSNETAAQIDQVVLNYIKSAHAKATEILRDNVSTLHRLSEYLLQKETITGEEFMQLLNQEENKI